MGALMNLICLSKDDVLTNKVEALYGTISVKVFTDYQLVPTTTLQRCDVMIVDLKNCLLPNGKSFFSPIIALSAVPAFQEAVAILQTGAKGYGNRHMRKENLSQAIESVKSGQIWLPPSVVVKLIDQVKFDSNVDEMTASKNSMLLEKLSKREQEVALYVAKGMSNQEIADIIFISLRTVKAHLTSVYEKTGLRNRLELGLQLKNVTTLVLIS